MKKVFYLAAIATLALFSCQGLEQEDATPKAITFKASIENFATKADINDANALVWAKDDKIGIYVNDGTWTDKNQPFTLKGDGGTTSGEFTWDNTGTFSDYANAAFFPWQGTGTDKNNVFGGTMYFKLLEGYYGYTSGQMLTPLVASLSNSSDPIRFKHAGAAVKVTINNLPAGAHSIGMSVDGQQVYGDYHINPANAGTDALTLDGAADNTKNTVWLNYTNDSESAFTFIFPVPTLTTPKLAFYIYEDHDILVWSANLKAQTSNLGRAQVLVMPPKDITPYAQFTTQSQWNVIGTVNNTSWNTDFPMYYDGTNANVCICKGVNFNTGDEFKIRKGDWEKSYPGSNWVFPNDYTPGKYDVFIKFSSDTDTNPAIWIRPSSQN